MFHKTSILVAGAVCGFASLASAVTGSGKMTSETRAVTGEHGVELASVGGLIITQGDKEELVIEAEDNLVPLIESDVNKDGVLVLRFKDHENIRPTKNITYRLTVKNLDRITLTGSGTIDSDHLTADREQIRLPGSGDIRIGRLDAGEVSVKVEGSGKVALSGGGARTQKLDIAGSGEYEASEFKTGTAEASISGSGAARLNARETLDVSISGSGEVSYTGDPKVTKKISGSGQLNHQ